MKKIILDLCGGTGAWSKPYKDAGYDVRVLTLPDNDIMNWEKGDMTEIAYLVQDSKIYGILAAPPCTMFSFARTNAKNPRDLREGMKTIEQCLYIINECQFRIKSDTQKKPPLKFWAIENPYGMLNWFLGEPKLIFNPYDYGDNYKKKTCVWGNFNLPKKNPVKCDKPKFDKLASKDIHPEMFGKLTRTERRAITPQGFAKAFFRANQ